MTHRVPDFAAVANDPATIVGLPRAVLADLRYQAALVVAACDRELTKTEGGRDWDQLVTADEIAKMLGRSVEYVYAHASEWPFTVAEEGKRPRFSRRLCEQWIARTAARRTA